MQIGVGLGLNSRSELTFSIRGFTDLFRVSILHNTTLFFLFPPFMNSHPPFFPPNVFSNFIHRNPNLPSTPHPPLSSLFLLPLLWIFLNNMIWWGEKLTNKELYSVLVWGGGVMNDDFMNFEFGGGGGGGVFGMVRWGDDDEIEGGFEFMEFLGGGGRGGGSMRSNGFWIVMVGYFSRRWLIRFSFSFFSPLGLVGWWGGGVLGREGKWRDLNEDELCHTFTLWWLLLSQQYTASIHPKKPPHQKLFT